jgi:hypothetical protein
MGQIGAIPGFAFLSEHAMLKTMLFHGYAFYLESCNKLWHYTDLN